MGLEPTTFGTTIRRSNQLSYIHRVAFLKSTAKITIFFKPANSLMTFLIRKCTRRSLYYVL